MSDARDSEYLGEADPVTGVPEGGGDPAPQLSDVEPGDLPEDDIEVVAAESDELETSDAVAGDTVDAGRGEAGENDGPTGGAPGEARPGAEDNPFGSS